MYESSEVSKKCNTETFEDLVEAKKFNTIFFTCLLVNLDTKHET